jgi:hypothetical protein
LFFQSDHINVDGRITAFVISARCEEYNLPPELIPSFRGFFALRLPNGAVITGMSRHEADGETWLEPPMSRYVLSGGSVRWLPCAAFTSVSDAQQFLREAELAIKILLQEDGDALDAS